MKKSRYNAEQIVFALRQGESFNVFEESASIYSLLFFPEDMKNRKKSD